MLKKLLISSLLLTNIAIAESPLPTNSILQIDNVFTTQNNSHITLASLRGNVHVVTMFYTSCQYVCPLIINSGFAIEDSLTPVEKKKLHFFLVSMDSANDTPDTLLSLAKKRNLDTSRWTLARTDAEGVRMLAALLGVRYRILADGSINHTSTLILLDSEGRVIAHTEKMGMQPDEEFLASIKNTLKTTNQTPSL